MYKIAMDHKKRVVRCCILFAKEKCSFFFKLLWNENTTLENRENLNGDHRTINTLNPLVRIKHVFKNATKRNEEY